MRFSQASLGSRAQGSGAGTPVELSESSLQNIMYNLFARLVANLMQACYEGHNSPWKADELPKSLPRQEKSKRRQFISQIDVE